METISFDKLLLNTAFCCMASDGNIDIREIKLIKSLCEKSKLLQMDNFEEEINSLVGQINTRGKEFITHYFQLLDSSNLTENDELTLIDFAIQTIKADDQIEYSEIKFFKNIRNRLKVSNARIMNEFPNIDMFLEDDLVNDSFIDKITNQYLDAAILPQFNLISIEAILTDESKNDN